MILQSLLLLGALLGPGQDPPVIHVPLPQNANDPHQQMLKLIGEVELRLRQIDKLLADASAAQRPSPGAPARTAELVKRSQEQGKQVVEAIDKILELADHAHPGGGS